MIRSFFVSLLLAAPLFAAETAAAQGAGDWTGVYGGLSVAEMNGVNTYAWQDEYGRAPFDLQTATRLGLHLGHRWDRGAFVLGLEGAVIDARIVENLTPDFGYDRLYDLKASVGYKLGDQFYYTSFGKVWSDFHFDSGDDTFDGHLVGIGFAHRLDDHITFGAEYNWRSLSGFWPDDGEGNSVVIDGALDSLELRLSYTY